MATLSLKNINKIYPNGTQAVFDFNLEIKDKEFICFVGPSGCGKSTTLRMIAGLEDISAGELWIDDRMVNDVSPKDRDIAMVFQSYALYPHMSVYENMAFGLRLRRIDRDVIKEKVKQAAEILGLTPYLERKPRQLSGGQCQRVALGRAIVRDAKVFLMDEPLSNLDAKLRVSTRGELIKLHRRLNATTIYVTHDQIESMAMADYIVLLNHGKIMQQDTPEEIYNNPANVFTAQFIGTPATNILPLHNGCYGFRPEKAYFISKDAANFEQYWKKGTILTREMLGSEVHYQIQTGNHTVMMKSTDFNHKVGENILFAVSTDNLYFFDSDGNRVTAPENIPEYLKMEETQIE